MMSDVNFRSFSSIHLTYIKPQLVLRHVVNGHTYTFLFFHLFFIGYPCSFKVIRHFYFITETRGHHTVHRHTEIFSSPLLRQWMTLDIQRIECYPINRVLQRIEYCPINRILVFVFCRTCLQLFVPKIWKGLVGLLPVFLTLCPGTTVLLTQRCLRQRTSILQHRNVTFRCT